MPAVPAVEGAAVGAVQVAHAAGDQAELRLEQEVIVRVHQARRMPLPRVAGRHTEDALDERLPVGVVAEDRVVVDPVRGQVVDEVAVVVARQTAHPRRLPRLFESFVTGRKSV
jgi:hypothetical protein